MDTLEQHYSPTDIAKPLGLSPRFVREMFQDEPGVIVIDRPEEMHKRSYTTLRIPESVLKRVLHKLQNK
jgi:hypothetical protein